ncbi:tyrosine--tRNA ligase, partial [Cetobacterium somerae]|uniref:S4 domain-containing protein n=1 Tax=Cetobacterium somerae TaxID=188913 RepID=UPI00211EDE8F
PLALLTFLPMDEGRRLSSLEGAEINEAKKVLAYEVTKIVHGKEEAEKAKQASEALFGQGGLDLTNVPTSEVTEEVLGKGVVELMVELGLLKTKSEGRRLVQQNGLTINDEKVTDCAMEITNDLCIDGAMMIKQGKKKYNRIVIK